MKRLEISLRWALAAALLLSTAALSAAPSPALAAGGQAASTTPANSLTSQYPLGTTTLCCQTTASGTPATRAPSTAKHAARPAVAGHAAHASTRTRGAGASTAKHAAAGSTGHSSVWPLRGAGLLVLGLVVGLLRVASSRGRGRGRRSLPTPGVTDAPALGPAPARNGLGPAPARNGSALALALPTPAPAPAENDSAPAAARNGRAPEDSKSNGHAPSTKPAHDPLQGLSLELLTGQRWQTNGGPGQGEPSAALSDGEGVYRFGVVLYERGQVDRAAAAWRLAAAREHPRAAMRLGMLHEERGDLEAARKAYCDAQRWGEPAAAQRVARLPPVPQH